MTTFKISAPGRVILCGEYTAMYGNKVVAASLDVRTKLTFVQLPEMSTIIKIEFPDIALSLDVPVQIIINFMSNKNYYIMVDDYISLFRYVKYFIILNGLAGSDEQRFSLQIFFFLLFFVAWKERRIICPFHVFLTTQLMLKGGVGSSTSFATCLAACFLHWACLQQGDHNEFTAEELTRISKYVMYSEEVIQNYVYHEDYNVCTYGYARAFSCSRTLNAQSEHIYISETNILLVNANIRLDKSQQKENLAKIRYDYGNAVDVLSEIDYISQGLIELFYTIGLNNQRYVDSNEHLTICEMLKGSFPLYQDFLHRMNMSHSNFNTICSIAKMYGLTGKHAGEGANYVIILLQPNISICEISNFMAHLAEEGFTYIVTSISCSGVQLE